MACTPQFVPRPRVLQWNCRALRPRLSELHDRLQLEEYDVLAVQEVYLQRDKLHLPGYIGYGSRTSCKQSSCRADPCLEDSHPRGSSRAAIFVRRTLAQAEILVCGGGHDLLRGPPWSAHPGSPPPPAAATTAPGRAEGTPHRWIRALDPAQPARREVPPVSQSTPQRVVGGHLCFPGGRQGECQCVASVPLAAGASHTTGPLPGHRSGRGSHLPAAG
ncbi:hypothetical protein V5799_010503 [Amblyomma americanum]|uniref:Endonuclease/exonuclease/phosphatase domain-containing protein n=1 Tax=Amblyomma americanum TaxID=6943 RepID=A0AAQ4EK03_AMBAM